MSFAIIFAFLSPLLWALVNVFDKYLVSHKIKKTMRHCGLKAAV